MFNMSKCFSVIVVLFLSVCTGYGQSSVSLNPIPLNKEISIELLGADTELLQCYNIYGFVYDSDGKEIQGEFIVPKDADTLLDVIHFQTKLCRVKEFAISVNGDCKNISTPNGIQIRQKGSSEMLYLNFDPDLPEPVFMPCK